MKQARVSNEAEFRCLVAVAFQGRMLNLSAPRALTFLVSLVLIGLAVASLYMRIPTIGPTVVKFRTWFFVGAYAVLALGVVTKSL